MFNQYLVNEEDETFSKKSDTFMYYMYVTIHKVGTFIILRYMIMII